MYGQNSARILWTFLLSQTVALLEYLDRHMFICQHIKWLNSMERAIPQLGCSSQEILNGQEVLYFFAPTHNQKSLALVMVQLFDNPLQEILKKTYYSCWITKTTKELIAVDIKSIMLVIALLPYKQLPDHWFLFEDFGLDVVHLQDGEFAINDFSDSQDGT
ncbi:hypothetical protein BKA70DRAFT_1219168 [Coprinopsis sp. MPI-PUGE-AT-0042]|nr:hypothetical protein BKA70DRAFT_1219168 [Coprinopsis sp. MPI-PUGE-AT-0042]